MPGQSPPFPGVKVSHLIVFQSTAKYGSFSRAAEALGCTTSAVSQQMAALERDAAVDLFVRGRRPMRLTDTGKVLLRHAEIIVASLVAAEMAVTAGSRTEPERVRLACFATAGLTLLPRAIGRFAALYPDVELTLTEASPETAIAALHGCTADAALAFRFDERSWLPDGALAEEDLLDDPINLVLPASHPLAGKARRALADVADETWVGPHSEPCLAYLRRLCARAGFEPRLGYQTDDFPTVLALVASGAGVALVPELAMPNRPQGVSLSAVAEMPATRRVSFLFRNDEPSPARDSLLEVLRAEINALRMPALTDSGTP
jgi:DNA-binding transcriptional LysR family regulator